MKVWIATVSTRHGTDPVVASSEEKLWSELRAFCEQFIDDAVEHDRDKRSKSKLLRGTDRTVVERYFEIMEQAEEYLEFFGEREVP